jgi:sarcosine oxidase subunit beta
MDRVEGIQGLYVCTGFSGHGFKLSPVVGVIMAELVLDGRATTIEISPLRMSRFREGRLNQARYAYKVLA